MPIMLDAHKDDGNASDNAEIGQADLDAEVLQMDTNEKIGIKGEELSYEDLFKKNKKRARGERHSFAVNSNSGPLQFNDGNRRNNKLKSMFNAPQSVRGIKRIEIEEK
jgi:hypothetical protein